MTAPFRIRLARPSDLRHLAAIEDEGVPMVAEHFGDRMPPSLATVATSGGQRDQSGVLHVAEADGRPVGFAHVTHHEDVAHLEQLSVLPAYGRRGIGTGLVRDAMAEARWSGAETMSLCTFRDVPWNGPFYRRLGFSEEARPAPFLERLRAYERRLGLDEVGVRVVMVVRLRRAATSG